MFGGPHPNIAIKNTGVFKYSVVILSLSLSLSREGGDPQKTKSENIAIKTTSRGP
jgi:hypothetical protein